MKSTLLMLLLAFGLVACVPATKVAPETESTAAYKEPIQCTQQSFSEYVALADAALKKAKSVKHEWVHTAKFLKKAKAQAKNGDYTGACKNAQIALIQGEMAYAQGISQKNAGPQF